LTANTVNGSGNGARSGAQTLVLLAAPLNVRILRSLTDEPKQQAELQRECGLPAQTTLRAQLKRLAEIGAIEKHRRNRFPGVIDYELTPVGQNLLFVAAVLEHWLGQAPDGPLPLESGAAKAATKALVEGWSTTMIRTLASGPLSLTELNSVITSLSYPSLERRLSAMRVVGQVEASAGVGRGRPYALTDWLRRATAPLAAAARWERRYLPHSTAPIAQLDVEATFLLTLPLLEVQAEPTGFCRLATELTKGGSRRLAGVTVEVEAGRIVSFSTRLQGHPDAWALGSAGAWLSAVIESERGGLELGGDCRLASSLLDALHADLFPVLHKVH
jgi:DNA-binding HxlR family transcriptional regulator